MVRVRIDIIRTCSSSTQIPSLITLTLGFTLRPSLPPNDLHVHVFNFQGSLKQLFILPGADASQLACPSKMPGLPSISETPEVQMEAGKFILR